jgi:hypothetical protein
MLADRRAANALYAAPASDASSTVLVSHIDIDLTYAEQ